MGKPLPISEFPQQLEVLKIPMVDFKQMRRLVVVCLKRKDGERMKGHGTRHLVNGHAFPIEVQDLPQDEDRRRLAETPKSDSVRRPLGWKPSHDMDWSPE